MKAADFAGRDPKLVIEDYFLGTTRAWGLFRDRFGTVRRQFTVDIDGTWDGKTLVLTEDFAYDNGQTERRVWRIEKRGGHGYEGHAEGVIGVAEGTAYGNALNWRYRFALPIGRRTIAVRFDDWLFLQANDVVINRADVRKFGVMLGEVILAFHKPPASPTAGSAGATTRLSAV